MLLETFKVIAMLCQITSGEGNISIVELKQTECQAYYVRCLDEEASMEKCVEKRFIDLLTRPSL